MYINPLLHWLFLDHDIIFFFWQHGKNSSYILNTFEILWKMEHLLQKSKSSIFHNIFKYMIFQRRQRALLWSKGQKAILAPSEAKKLKVAFHYLSVCLFVLMIYVPVNNF